MSLHMSFPHEVPDARIEIGLVLPTGRTAECLGVRLDGMSQSPDWRCEPVPGTSRMRVRTALSAAADLEITLGLRARRRERTVAIAG
jgi:hypothetical protein